MQRPRKISEFRGQIVQASLSSIERLSATRPLSQTTREDIRMIPSNTVRFSRLYSISLSHSSNISDDPRIKAAAQRCAQKIKESAEAHNANIEAAYQDYREAVAQIESEELSLTPNS
jgi:hypothetical protein